MSALRLAGCRVTRDEREVVHGVDLTVESGEWLSLIGPNGAGKTTLLHAIAGMLESEGTIQLEGDDPRTWSSRRRARHIALVPQRPHAPPGLTVTDFVLLGRTPYIPYLGVESHNDLSVVGDVLGRLGLAALHDRPVSHLSGGELQRAVLARALVQQAPLLLLDEPTSSLDVGHQQEVLELVDRLRHTDNLTVVAAMHGLTVAGQYADRIALLVDGHIVADGAPHEVLDEPTIARWYGARVRVLDDGDGNPVVTPVRSLVRRDA